VVDQSGLPPLLLDGYRQRRGRQFNLHVILHGPTDDLPAEEIHDGIQIQPALRGRDVGDVGEPDPVRGWGRKVSRDQVRCGRQAVAVVGGTDPARRATRAWRHLGGGHEDLGSA